MGDSFGTVKVAAVQAASVFLDRAGSTHAGRLQLGPRRRPTIAADHVRLTEKTNHHDPLGLRPLLVSRFD